MRNNAAQAKPSEALSERVSKRKNKSGRPKNAKNYSGEEVMKLLDVVAEYKPSGGNEWYQAYSEYKQ